MRSPDLPSRPQSRALFTLALIGTLNDTMPPISGTGEILTDYTARGEGRAEIVVIERDGRMYTLLNPRTEAWVASIHDEQDARMLPAVIEEIVDAEPVIGCIVCRDASGVQCCEYGRAA